MIRDSQDRPEERWWESSDLEMELDDYGRPDTSKVLAVWIQEAREELAGKALTEDNLELLAQMRGRVQWTRAHLENCGYFNRDSFAQVTHLHQWERDLWWLERELGV